VGGTFTLLGGQACTNLGRLNANGTLDTSFTAGASDWVTSLAIQADGGILAGGRFTMLAGQPRASIGRLVTGSAAVQALSLSADGGGLSWSRGGSGPEIEQVTFELSPDGSAYSSLGNANRVSNGWRLGGVSLPVGDNFYVRARGRAIGGEFAGSSSLLESVAQFYRPPPLLGSAILSGGAVQFSFTTGTTNFTLLATTNVALPYPNWIPVGPATPLGGGTYQFSEPASSPQRLYRLRFP